MLKLFESMANNFAGHLQYPSQNLFYEVACNPVLTLTRCCFIACLNILKDSDFLTLDGSLFQITLPI